VREGKLNECTQLYFGGAQQEISMLIS